jgi:hypothetical protein
MQPILQPNAAFIALKHGEGQSERKKSQNSQI